MTSTPVRMVERGLNGLLRPVGLRLIRTGGAREPEQFIPFKKTVSAARKAGLSVADYVDVTYNDVAGATQQTIDRMAELQVFADTVDVVVEIGPGSGRYLEKVMHLCSPTRYEIYETAEPWAEYLERTYDVVRQPTGGSSLGSTPNDSVDLVQAHKVFVITTFLTTCSYWLEMLRVARPSAHIVFDIVTEGCMEPETLQRWLSWQSLDRRYPMIVPRGYAVKFFESRGASLVGSFHIPMRPGTTETLVFRTAADR